MLWHDTRHGDAPLALVHQEDVRHPRSAPVARLIGRSSDGGSGRMALRFPESVNWKIGLSGRRAPTSKVRKTLDATASSASSSTLAQNREDRQILFARGRGSRTRNFASFSTSMRDFPANLKRSPKQLAKPPQSLMPTLTDDCNCGGIRVRPFGGSGRLLRLSI